MTENEIARIVVNAALKIHRILGPGLLESVYEAVLAHELRGRGLFVTRQMGVAVYYEGLKVDLAFRADMIVNQKVIIEIKSVETVAPVHFKQLQTYLKLTNCTKGYLSTSM